MRHTSATATLFSVAVLMLGRDFVVAGPTTGPTTQPAALTNHDLFRVRVAFQRRTLVGAYDATGRHSVRWDAPARAFLELAALRFAEADVDPMYHSGVDVSAVALLKLAESLKDCDDPLVNVARAMVFRDANRPNTYTGLIRQWAPQVIAGNYPANQRFAAAAELLRLDDENVGLILQRDAMLVAKLRMPLVDPLERHILVWDLDNVWNVEDRLDPFDKANRRRAVLDAIADTKTDAKAGPPADPWVVALARSADGLIIGDELFNTDRNTTAETQKMVDDGVARCRAALLTAYALEPTYAEAPARMIDLCSRRSGHFNELRLWFDRSVKCQVDLRLAWNALTNKIRPRAGGSLDAMEALAAEAAATKRFDTWIPYQAVRIVQKMREDGGETIYRRPGVWPLLCRVYDGYCDSHEPNVNVAWMRSAQVAFAWKCGAYADALGMLKVMGKTVVPEAMAFLNTTPDVVRAECRLMTGPNGEICRAAALDELNSDYAKARDAYDAVLGTMDAKDADRPTVLRHRGSTALSAALESGGERGIPLDGPDDLLVFTGDRRAWHAEDGVLTLDGKPNSDSMLMFPADLPRRMRMSVEFQWSTPKPGNAPGVQVIIQDTEYQGLVFFHIYPRDNLIELMLGPNHFTHHRNPERPMRAPPDAWQLIEVVHDGPTVNVSLNGEVVIDPVESGWFSRRGHPVFGLRVGQSPVGGTVRFRNLSIEPLR